jgi:polyketide synthase PksN
MATAIEFLVSLAGKGVKLSIEGDQLNCYARQGALTEDIKIGIGRYRPEILELLRKQQREPATRARVSAQPAAPRRFPLSAGQKGLYVLHELAPESGAYNVPLCFRSRGGVDVNLLAQAWDLVLERYPILTAKIVEQDGVLYHCLDPACKTTVMQQPITCSDGPELLEFLRARAQQPFDLETGPLTRLELFTLDAADAVLLLTIHHIVVDGTSTVILLRSLFACYRQLCAGQQVPVPQGSSRYGEFVAWEQALLESAQGAAHADYWRQQLSGAPPALELSPDRGRSSSAVVAARTLIAALPARVSQRIAGLCRTHSVPPAAVFLAVFQLLLHRYTGQEDLIVTMPVLGRAGGRFKDEIGYFINMVPLRSQYNGRAQFSEVLQRAQRTMLDALYHSPYPFPLLVNDLKLTGSAAADAFRTSYAYQNMLQLQETSLPDRHGPEVEMISEICQEGAADLAVEIFESGASFIVHLKYSSALLTEAAAQRLLGLYQNLLNAVTSDPSRPAHEYSLLNPEEEQRVLVAFNQTQAEYRSDKCIHELFAEQVRKTPVRTAVVFGEQALSYRELHERSQQVALYLQALGVGPDSLVGLCMERSLDMLVGLLGILQAGGAYVPLDPEYPQDRLAHMLQDSRARVVLTQERLRARLSTLLSKDSELLALDEQWLQIEAYALAARTNNVPLRRLVRPDNLTYVIYTSGSTGKPKGAAVYHRGLSNLLRWYLQVLSLSATDRVLVVTSTSFDLTQKNLLGPLLRGGCVHLAPELFEPNTLVGVIQDSAITVMNLTPSAFYAIDDADSGAALSSLRYVMLGGEPISAARLQQLQQRYLHLQVINSYGPTECADVCAYHLIGQQDLETRVIPIGRPVPHTRLYVLDAKRRPVPIGVPGEIYVGGVGVGAGYLNQPQRTAERFGVDPFAGEPQGRMYATGDLGRWLEEGTIEYLGRIDTQVKIRGFRIELGEIEARLNEHAQIEESVVIAQGEDAGKRLIAFYRSRNTAAGRLAGIDPQALRAHLLQVLPGYMLPAAFISLERIPLSPNGKVDRRALAQTQVILQAAREYVAPRDETERQLALIWARVLGRGAQKVGVNDSFFELGGHSLLVTQLLSRIRTEFQINLPLKTLFDESTLGGMASVIRAVAGTTDEAATGAEAAAGLEEVLL